MNFYNRFSVEMWIKAYTINGFLFQKDNFNILLENGKLLFVYENKVISPLKASEYAFLCDSWNHIAIVFRRKEKQMKILLNCEVISIYSVGVIEGIGSKGDIILGNANFDGEITEFRIWNQALPIKIIKDNYKSPLAILTENKKKILMKINKQDGGKKKGFAKGGFGVNSKISYLN